MFHLLNHEHLRVSLLILYQIILQIMLLKHEFLIIINWLILNCLTNQELYQLHQMLINEIKFHLYRKILELI